MRKPSRDPFSTCGAALMFSWPPATTMSESPLAMDCAPSIAAFRPEPQTLLMVIAGTMSGSPAQMDAWRAGFCPTPAASTWPMMTSETWSGATPARSSTLRMMCAPSLAAGTPASEPPNLPIAVRAAPTMTISSMMVSWLCLLLHIAPRCGLDRGIFRTAGLCRRFTGFTSRAALESFQPLRPLRPPAAAQLTRLLEPVVGIGRIFIRGPVATLVAGGGIDHAGDVPARAEDEFLCSAQQSDRPVGGAPRNDVVLARREDECRPVHLAQVHADAAVAQRAGHAQFVLEVGVAHVAAVHRSRQVGAVGIPVEQVEGRRRAAHQVVVDHVGPDEVVGAQRVEGRGEVRARQQAAFADRGLSRHHRVFIDEH